MNSTTHTLIAENAARASLKAKSAEEREKAIRAILTHDLPSVVQVAFEAEGITTDLMMEGLAVRGSSHGDGCCSSIIAQALVSQAALRTDAAMVLRRAVQLRPDIAHDLMVGCVTHLRTVAMGNRKVSWVCCRLRVNEITFLCFFRRLSLTGSGSSSASASSRDLAHIPLS